MTSSDERREVAARLRALADGGSPMTECSVDSLYIALGVPCSCGTGIECTVIGYLADLIDPTCEMDDAGDVPASVKDNLSTFFCSECGAPVYNDMSPSYCLYCGARVVDGGDA